MRPDGMQFDEVTAALSLAMPQKNIAEPGLSVVAIRKPKMTR